jgi:type IV pilus assembly protein PilX
MSDTDFNCGHAAAHRRTAGLHAARSGQQGAALIVSLLMLVAVMLLGVSAAHIALEGEKASRNDRDRQLAFQAAEAGLMDAEMDIENASGPASRSHIFTRDSKKRDL